MFIIKSICYLRHLNSSYDNLCTGIVLYRYYSHKDLLDTVLKCSMNVNHLNNKACKHVSFSHTESKQLLSKKHVSEMTCWAGCIFTKGHFYWALYRERTRQDIGLDQSKQCVKKSGLDHNVLLVSTC